MRRSATTALSFGLAVAALAAACGSPSPPTDPAATPVPQSEPTAREPGPSALEQIDHPDLPRPLVDPDEIISGGPPPDGIPSIDEPAFVRAAQARWLEPAEPVLVLAVDDEVRAYPVQILIWHEIVNDTVAGVPLAVTYCPLCNSAIAFERRLGDRLLEFGTSGRLYRSALVMYDRQTESLWTHFTGQAVAGRLTGETLRARPVSTVSWADARRAHPDILVLSRDTGFDREYGRNPYPGYDDPGTDPFLFSGPADERLAAKTRIVGIESGGHAAAVTLERLRSRRTVAATLDGQELVVFWKSGTASALDSAEVAGGRDVGATGVFLRDVAGRELTFRPSGDQFEDVETGSRWDIFGRAVDGPLAGSSLTAVPHVDTFWFAWAAYRPATVVVP